MRPCQSGLKIVNRLGKSPYIGLGVGFLVLDRLVETGRRLVIFAMLPERLLLLQENAGQVGGGLRQDLIEQLDFIGERLDANGFRRRIENRLKPLARVRGEKVGVLDLSSVAHDFAGFFRPEDFIRLGEQTQVIHTRHGKMLVRQAAAKGLGQHRQRIAGGLAVQLLNQRWQRGIEKLIGQRRAGGFGIFRRLVDLLRGDGLAHHLHRLDLPFQKLSEPRRVVHQAKRFTALDQIGDIGVIGAKSLEDRRRLGEVANEMENFFGMLHRRARFLMQFHDLGNAHVRRAGLGAIGGILDAP